MNEGAAEKSAAPSFRFESNPDYRIPSQDRLPAASDDGNAEARHSSSISSCDEKRLLTAGDGRRPTKAMKRAPEKETEPHSSSSPLISFQSSPRFRTRHVKAMASSSCSSKKPEPEATKRDRSASSRKRGIQPSAEDIASIVATAESRSRIAILKRRASDESSRNRWKTAGKPWEKIIERSAYTRETRRRRRFADLSLRTGKTAILSQPSTKPRASLGDRARVSERQANASSDRPDGHEPPELAGSIRAQLGNDTGKTATFGKGRPSASQRRRSSPPNDQRLVQRGPNRKDESASHHDQRIAHLASGVSPPPKSSSENAIVFPSSLRRTPHSIRSDGRKGSKR